MNETNLEQGYRFVWRYADNRNHWRTKSFPKAASVEQALQALHAHITKKLGKDLKDVVVDHVFYKVHQLKELEGAPAWTSTPLALREVEHPFWFEFNNRVYAPASKNLD